MMNEIKAPPAAVNPVETLFVIDAMLGRYAVDTAHAFNVALPLTDVVLIKLDWRLARRCRHCPYAMLILQTD